MPKIIFIMGVSGSWKTTVLKESGILAWPDIIYVPSRTTRPLRPWEIDGIKYHHVNDDTFKDGISKDQFLEFAYVHQTARYGTPQKQIMDILGQNKNPIKELEMGGLLKIQEQKKIENKYISIFLNIPTTLVIERIRQRWVLSDEETKQRVTSAEFESEQAKVHCDYIVDATQQLELVIENVINIIKSEIRK